MLLKSSAAVAAEVSGAGAEAAVVVPEPAQKAAEENAQLANTVLAAALDGHLSVQPPICGALGWAE